MLVRIHPDSGEPLFAQIAASLRAAIGKNEVRPGERLPSARELADSLDVNMHTVLRAYKTLQGEGLIDMRRGRGVVVLDAARPRARLVQLAKALLVEARRQDVSLAELGELLESLS